MSMNNDASNSSDIIDIDEVEEKLKERTEFTGEEPQEYTTMKDKLLLNVDLDQGYLTNTNLQELDSKKYQLIKDTFNEEQNDEFREYIKNLLPSIKKNITQLESDINVERKKSKNYEKLNFKFFHTKPDVNVLKNKNSESIKLREIRNKIYILLEIYNNNSAGGGISYSQKARKSRSTLHKQKSKKRSTRRVLRKKTHRKKSYSRKS
jgi:hypothetical protein